MSDAAEKPVYMLDIETYRTVFLVGLKRISDGYVRIFEQSARSKINYDLLRRIIMGGTVVTYNGQGYDMPLLWYAIDGHWDELDPCIEDWASPEPFQTARRDRTCLELKAASDKIIKGGLRWWESPAALGVEIPRNLDHIDLMEPQPNPFASLKLLNARMHGRWLQDLPYHHDDYLGFDQIDKLREYLHNDLQATEDLYRILKEPVELREYLGGRYGRDFRSMSDPQVGENMMKIGVERRTGRRVYKATPDRSKTFRYNVPAWADFNHPDLRQLVEDIRGTTFRLGADLKVVKPDTLSDRIVRIGETDYAVGIGGIHSTEANRALRADSQYALVDADVASQYPMAILSLGLVPDALGPAFLEEYRSLRNERIEAKRAKDKAKDKGMKIGLNGIYGKLGSPYSALFGPHLMIGVTLSCQLSILLLIERLEAEGFQVVSANTDGVLIRAKRTRFAGVEKDRLVQCDLSKITDKWEADTGFDLEFGEFAAIFNQSVNSYFALKKGGGHKRKGPLGNPWSPHKDDFDPVRGQLMKNPQMTICSDAALAFFKDGTPIEETIRGCRDIRQFVTVIQSREGANWRGGYLGKVVRYYWALDGDDITSAKENASGNFNKVPKTDGSRPCMTLPDEFPDDIDYARYEAETKIIIEELGYYGAPARPIKYGRLTKAKYVRILPWALLG